MFFSCRAVKAFRGQLVGQVPVGSDGIVVKGGITEQTEQVLANVKAALALAGCTLDDVVKTTVWLEDARDFGAFNAVYARHFPKNPPARTTVEALRTSPRQKN